MTAQQVLSAVHDRWPHAHGAQTVHDLTLQAENLARAEVLGAPTLAELPEEPLSIPAPYDAAYVHFVCALLAQMDAAYDRYNAEIALYTTLYDDFARAYRRANLPPCRTQVTAYG